MFGNLFQLPRKKKKSNIILNTENERFVKLDPSAEHETQAFQQ